MSLLLQKVFEKEKPYALIEWNDRNCCNHSTPNAEGDRKNLPN